MIDWKAMGVPLRREGETDEQYKERASQLTANGTYRNNPTNSSDPRFSSVSGKRAIGSNFPKTDTGQPNPYYDPTRDRTGAPLTKPQDAGGRGATGPRRNGADVGNGMDKYGNSISNNPTMTSNPNAGAVGSGTGTTGTSGANVNTSNTQQPTQGSMYGGAFNLNSIIEQFYNWKPDANDDEGRAIKNTTQADMVNSAFQTQLAQMMAQSQAGISKDMMNFQQMLERQAAGEARKEEFEYGMQSMGAQFEHQNNFANAQYDRDVGMLGATGEQERLNMEKRGNQDRLTQIVQGEQSRLNIGAQGSQDRMNIAAQGESDIAKIGAQGNQDRQNITTQQAAQGLREQANISAQGTQDRANIKTQQQAQAEREVGNIQAQGEADRQNIVTQQQSQGERERGNIGAQGEQDRQNIGAQGDVDVRKIEATGGQERQTMEKGDELQAKKANRQQARARSLARAF